MSPQTHNGWEENKKLILYRIDELKNLYVAQAGMSKAALEKSEERMMQSFASIERKIEGYEKRLRVLESFHDKVRGHWATLGFAMVILGAVSGYIAFLSDKF
jgi:hypothetical protein